MSSDHKVLTFLIRIVCYLCDYKQLHLLSLSSSSFSGCDFVLEGGYRFLLLVYCSCNLPKFSRRYFDLLMSVIRLIVIALFL